MLCSGLFNKWNKFYKTLKIKSFEVQTNREIVEVCQQKMTVVIPDTKI